MLVILLCCEHLFFSIIVEFLGYHKLVPAELKQKFFLSYKKIRRGENIRLRTQEAASRVLLLKFIWNYNKNNRVRNYTWIGKSKHAETIVLKNRKEVRQFLETL